MSTLAVLLLLLWPCYNAILAVFALWRPRPRNAGHGTGLRFWIVTTKPNESLFELDPVRVLVIDEGQEALNAAYHHIRSIAVTEGAERRTVIGLVDGQPQPGMLSEVAKYFSGRNVGAVQCRVRIHDRAEVCGFLKDLEFACVGDASQRMRDVLGSVELGRNGQFVRLDALTRLGDEPWSGSLELRLYQAGMAIRYATDAVISQDAPQTKCGRWFAAASAGTIIALAILAGTYAWLAVLLAPGLLWGLVHRLRFGDEPWHRSFTAAILYPIYLALRTRVTNVVPTEQRKLLRLADGHSGLSA